MNCHKKNSKIITLHNRNNLLIQNIIKTAKVISKLFKVEIVQIKIWGSEFQVRNILIDKIQETKRIL